MSYFPLLVLPVMYTFKQVQLDLVQAVLTAVGDSKPVVVVLTNGGPLSCTYIRDNVPTVVEAFEGGQFAGTALAPWWVMPCV